MLLQMIDIVIILNVGLQWCWCQCSITSVGVMLELTQVQLERSMCTISQRSPIRMSKIWHQEYLVISQNDIKISFTPISKKLSKNVFIDAHCNYCTKTHVTSIDMSNITHIIIIPTWL